MEEKGRINGILCLEPFDRWDYYYYTSRYLSRYPYYSILRCKLGRAGASKASIAHTKLLGNHALKRRHSHSLAHMRNVVSRARQIQHKIELQPTAVIRETQLLVRRGFGASRTDVPQIYPCLFLPCSSWWNLRSFVPQSPGCQSVRGKTSRLTVTTLQPDYQNT
jgi:hypothetical protein